MTTLTLHSSISTQKYQYNLPATGRGRAIHTVAWFLNGVPTWKNCDDPELHLGQINHIND